MNQIRKHWLLGLVGLGAAIFAICIFLAYNDCPSTVCVNPISHWESSANARVTGTNQIQSRLIEENRALIPSFERDECFNQDERFVSVCQTINIETAYPSAFNYVFSRQDNLKSYVGGVFVVKVRKQEKATQSIVCEAQVAGTQVIDRPIDAQTCGSGTIRVKGHMFLN